MKNRFDCPNHQQGAVLVVSLIMLLLLTLIGLSGMQSTLMEEKMSGNAKDYNLAFQAAEVALRDAEAYVASLVTAVDFDNQIDYDGLLSEAEDEPDYFSPDTWYGRNGSNVGSIQPSEVVSSLHRNQPRYIIKFVAENDPDSNARLLVRGYGEQPPGARVTVFKVTARGSGSSEDSQVLLQSNVGHRF